MQRVMEERLAEMRRINAEAKIWEAFGVDPQVGGGILMAKPGDVMDAVKEQAERDKRRRPGTMT